MYPTNKINIDNNCIVIISRSSETTLSQSHHLRAERDKFTVTNSKLRSMLGPLLEIESPENESVEDLVSIAVERCTQMRAEISELCQLVCERQCTFLRFQFMNRSLIQRSSRRA